MWSSEAVRLFVRRYSEGIGRQRINMNICFGFPATSTDLLSLRVRNKGFVSYSCLFSVAGPCKAVAWAVHVEHGGGKIRRVCLL